MGRERLAQQGDSRQLTDESLHPSLFWGVNSLFSCVYDGNNILDGLRMKSEDTNTVTGQCKFTLRNTDRLPQSEVPRAQVSIFPLASAFPRLRTLRRGASTLWHISSTALMNAYHHWKIRISKDTVDFGPALRRLPDGSLLPEERTLARSRCTDSLLATRPWVDSVDVQIFLEGFEAGEQWSLHTSGMGNEHNKHAGA